MAEKEYIEREALIDKRRKVVEVDEAGYCMGYHAVPIGVIEAIPAADVVEVVRCKDCVYWEDSEKVHTPMCCNIDGLGEPDADDFCSYGERKEQK